MTYRPAYCLSLCVAAALLPRLFTNLIFRSEFVGWFNHSTYYWVQTRALLRDGALAYEDMPALFQLYAGTATVIGWTGAAIDDAVVLASRLTMAVVPALIPLAAFRLAQIANAGRPIGLASWSVILASGFLPLTYAHMPETLQKNMLGMLLLACTLVALLAWFNSRRITKLAVIMVLAIAIVSVHIGSGLAVFLLLLAVAVDHVLSSVTTRQILQQLAVIGSLALVIFVMVSTYYPGAMLRVSAVVVAFVPATVGQAFGMLAFGALWLGITALIWRWIRAKASTWDTSVAALGRVCFLWACLLALPFWPGEIGMRLLLFMPLAGIALLMLLLSQVTQRWPAVVAVCTAIGFLAMSVGEAVSQAMIYPHKDRIAAELHELRDDYHLQRSDLVITPYGVGPTANWFLGTKAALITAVTEDTFNVYDRVFVLNTLERAAPILPAESCKLMASEFDRYQTTRHDIPLHGTTRDPAFEQFAVIKLDELPATWHFDTNGNWIGWGDCAESGRGERI